MTFFRSRFRVLEQQGVIPKERNEHQHPGILQFLFERSDLELPQGLECPPVPPHLSGGASLHVTLTQAGPTTPAARRSPGSCPTWEAPMGPCFPRWAGPGKAATWGAHTRKKDPRDGHFSLRHLGDKMWGGFPFRRIKARNLPPAHEQRTAFMFTYWRTGNDIGHAHQTYSSKFQARRGHA